MAAATENAARAVAAAANAGAARLWRLRRRTQRGLSPLLRMKAKRACIGCDGGCSVGCRRCCE